MWSNYQQEKINSELLEKFKNFDIFWKMFIKRFYVIFSISPLTYLTFPFSFAQWSVSSCWASFNEGTSCLDQCDKFFLWGGNSNNLLCFQNPHQEDENSKENSSKNASYVNHLQSEK